jgi:hypothetical protein
MESLNRVIGILAKRLQGSREKVVELSDLGQDTDRIRMNDLARLEYEALRATIRERGSLRIPLMLAGLTAWAGSAILAGAYGQGAQTLVPLLVLAASFETGHALHLGVERIGRFLQVFYEDGRDAGGPLWETTVMAYSRAHPAIGPDALFTRLYVLATIVNFLALLGSVARRPGWLLVALLANGVFLWRIKTARASATARNDIDLQRFRSLKAQGPASDHFGNAV